MWRKHHFPIYPHEGRGRVRVRGVGGFGGLSHLLGGLGSGRLWLRGGWEVLQGGVDDLGADVGAECVARLVTVVHQAVLRVLHQQR